MADPGNGGQQRGVRFDPTINLSGALTFLAMVIGGIVAFSKLEGSVDRVSDKLTYAVQRLDEQNAAQNRRIDFIERRLFRADQP